MASVTRGRTTARPDGDIVHTVSQRWRWTVSDYRSYDRSIYRETSSRFTLLLSTGPFDDIYMNASSDWFQTRPTNPISHIHNSVTGPLKLKCRILKSAPNPSPAILACGERLITHKSNRFSQSAVCADPDVENDRGPITLVSTMVSAVKVKKGEGQFLRPFVTWLPA